MSILEQLIAQLQAGQLEQIGRSAGVSRDQVGSVLEGALPGLLGGLPRRR